MAQGYGRNPEASGFRNTLTGAKLMSKGICNWWLRCAGLLVLLGLGAMPALAEGEGPVSRKEFNDLKTRNKALEDEVHTLKKNAVTKDSLDESMDGLADEVEDYLRKDIDMNGAARPGTTNFLLTGYGTAGYADEATSNGTFDSTFNPIFLWKLSEKLFFEGEAEFELEDDTTAVNLEYAMVTYTPTNWLTLIGGKFLNPFGIFRERMHPAWINKLPDKPLGYTGGANKLIASERLGFQARGVFPFRNGMRANVVLFVTNGPTLVTDDPAKYGQLADDNFHDANNNKSFGGRVGFSPFPWIELGYSFDFFQATPTSAGVEKATFTIQGFDGSVHLERKKIHGTIDVRFEVILSEGENITYDPTGSIGFGPVGYNNERTAWYIQIAYRATLADSEVLKNLEFVIRVDGIDHPRGAPSGLDETRGTFGVNYWVGPSAVVKVAVRIANTRGGTDDDAFLFQWVIGF